MVTQKLMGKNLRLPTGLLSHHAFLLDEVTIRSVENGRMAQAKQDIILNLPTTDAACSNQEKWKGIVWEPNKMYVAKWEDKLQAKSSTSGSATQHF